MFEVEEDRVYEKYYNHRAIPDISASGILLTSFFTDLQQNNTVNPLYKQTCEYLGQSYPCYPNNGAYISYEYINGTKLNGIDEYDYDYILPDKGYKRSHIEFGKPNNWTYCNLKGHNDCMFNELEWLSYLKPYETVMYLIPYNSSIYYFDDTTSTSEQKLTAGVFGLAPNSQTWDWLTNVYYKTLVNST